MAIRRTLLWWASVLEFVGVLYATTLILVDLFWKEAEPPAVYHLLGAIWITVGEGIRLCGMCGTVVESRQRGDRRRMRTPCPLIFSWLGMVLVMVYWALEVGRPQEFYDKYDLASTTATTFRDSRRISVYLGLLFLYLALAARIAYDLLRPFWYSLVQPIPETPESEQAELLEE